MAGTLGIIAFAVMILFAIFFHELGHFVTARWARIKVTKFFVGFGPTIWSTRRGVPEVVTVERKGRLETVTRPETEYGVKALPLGGFVKIVGMSPLEEVSPEDEPRAFSSVPAWKRAIVLAAGSVTHFITAFIVLWFVFVAVGIPNPDRPTLTVDAVQTEIAGETSPAQKAGIEPGDRILELNGAPVDRFEDVRAAVRSGQGKPVTLEIEKADGDVRRVQIRPVVDETSDPPVPVIGIYPKNELSRQNPIRAIGSTTRAMTTLLSGFFDQVPNAFSPSSLGLTGDGPSEDRPFSIIGAGKIAGDLASRGSILDFLLLFVQINVFIAVFNMLPLPPLDGGHLLVLGIEKIRGKPLSPRAIMPVAAVVLCVLLMLGVLLAYYDIVEPPQLPTGP
jgi:membrane-associated protease RseP (regulator of RpoE activity)